jgi:hypothetical protein
MEYKKRNGMRCLKTNRGTGGSTKRKERHLKAKE